MRDGDVVAEALAQPGDLLLQRLHRAARGGVAPQRLDQVVDADRLGRPERERAEEGALLGTHELHRRPGDPDLERAEHLHVHVRHPRDQR